MFYFLTRIGSFNTFNIFMLPVHQKEWHQNDPGAAWFYTQTSVQKVCYLLLLSNILTACSREPASRDSLCLTEIQLWCNIFQGLWGFMCSSFFARTNLVLGDFPVCWLSQASFLLIIPLFSIHSTFIWLLHECAYISCTLSVHHRWCRQSSRSGAAVSCEC